MMFKIRIAGLIALALIFSVLGTMPASAAGLASCLYVSDGKFSEFNKQYSFTIKSACDYNTSSQLRDVKITFYPNATRTKSQTQYFYYGGLTGKTYYLYIDNYTLTSASPGVQSPFIEISVPWDRSSATLSLPTYTIADPSRCIRVTDSRYNDTFDRKLSIDFVNNCRSLSLRDYGGVKMTLDIPGYYGLIEEKVSDISYTTTTIDFRIPDSLDPGTYRPSLEVSGYNVTKFSFDINAFTIPGKQNNPSTGGSGKKICTTAPGIGTDCTNYPNFRTGFCSSIKNGTLQEYYNGKWTKLWVVYGTKDLSQCQSKYPYYVLISGTTKIKSASRMRIVFAGTSKAGGYTQYLNLKVRS